MRHTLVKTPPVACSRVSTGSRFVCGGVTVIIPCYNEYQSAADTVRQVSETMRATGWPYEVIAVDDGSTDGTYEALDACAEQFDVRVIHNRTNRGYGYSLKCAVREARYEIIVITDADGTYPNERIGALVEFIADADMVVGARTGVDVNIPLLRRPAKWALRKLASYLAGKEIPDLNSGLRVMKKRLINRFINLLPDGFSFTTTITLALLTAGYDVRYVPISYEKRIGQSSIRPIHDTINFVSLIVRTVMYFKPLKVFAPASAGLFGLAVAWALTSFFALGQLADVSVLVISMASMQVLALGLLADLISKRVPAAVGTLETERVLLHGSTPVSEAGHMDTVGRPYEAQPDCRETLELAAGSPIGP